MDWVRWASASILGVRARHEMEADGAQGAQSVQGLSGADGANGSDGIDGAVQGLSGTDGTNGSDGIDGAVQGLSGADGIQGVSGTNGTAHTFDINIPLRVPRTLMGRYITRDDRLLRTRDMRSEAHETAFESPKSIVVECMTSKCTGKLRLTTYISYIIAI